MVFVVEAAAIISGVDGTYVANRQVSFIPYIFVDNAAAAATGREIFGFPKQAASIQYLFKRDASLLRTPRSRNARCGPMAAFAATLQTRR